MSHFFVSNAEQLESLLEQLRRSDWVAFDTEFISEGRYRPQLCLVQVGFENGLALIDPLALQDIVPFWESLCDGRREVIVHAGRSELEFCFRELRRFPERVFDVQLAAGFIGIDYPSGFRVLLEKLLGTDVSKSETRTDWRKRPLSPSQIEYALNDVRYLEPLASLLKTRLEKLGRLEWYREEMTQRNLSLREEFEAPKWRGTAKSSRLSPPQLAILRELWSWRDRLAKQTNRVAGRILRDDLLIELSKLQSADPERIQSIRGMVRGDLARHYDEIAASIRRALSLDPAELPRPFRQHSYPQYTVMVQFLFSVLNMICQKKRLASSLVGTQNDVREFIAHSCGTLPEGIVPRLVRGWRAGVIGEELAGVLNGEIALRLNRDNPDTPIEFVVR